jgi:hypothetical protein
MLRDDAVSEGETDTVALRLGCEEGNEDLLQICG